MVVAGKKTFETAVTPSGIEIEYHWAPKRQYRLRSLGDDHPLEWRDVPSVTEVLDCLKKDGLHWWGMKVGVEGLRQLLMMGIVPGSTEEAVELLKTHKLTVNHARDKAGDRGLAVHDAFEVWATTGHKPAPNMYPEEERGYIRGLLEFLTDVPLEPEASEVMVGSLEHGYAGRYDLRATTHEECQVVGHRTPVRGPQHFTLKPSRLLIDLKTSKGVYPSHSRQLEAYEAASMESGYDPTDARGILHVNADGTYEFVRSIGTFEDFLPVLDVWRSDQAMKGRKR